MIIELMGLPGSGKSTYAKKLQQDNNKYILPLNKYIYSRFRVIRNIKKMKLIILFFCCNKVIFNVIRKKMDRVEFKSTFLKYKMFAYLISTLQIVDICKRKNEVYVLDEGICQVFWGILFNSIEDEAYKIFELFSILKEFIGDEIIELKLSTDIIEKRLKNRSSKGGDELKRELLNWNNAIYISEDYMRKIKGFLKKNDISIKQII